MKQDQQKTIGALTKRADAADHAAADAKKQGNDADAEEQALHARSYRTRAAIMTALSDAHVTARARGIRDKIAAKYDDIPSGVEMVRIDLPSDQAAMNAVLGCLDASFGAVDPPVTAPEK